MRDLRQRRLPCASPATSTRLRTSVRMRAASSPLALLHHALERGSLIQAEAAARECGRLELQDALRLVLLFLRKRDGRYERAAIKWLGRVLAEHPAIGFEHAEDAVGALKALGGPYGNVARARLAMALRAVDEVSAAQVVERGAADEPL